MRKFLVLILIFVAQGAFAAECDLAANGDLSYILTKGGSQFSRAMKPGELAEAIHLYVQAVGSGVCAPSSVKHVCDLIMNPGAGYLVTRDGSRFLQLSDTAELGEAIHAVTALGDAGLCVLAPVKDEK